MIYNEQKGQLISVSCRVFLSKASTGYFELLMNSYMVAIDPNPLSCKLFKFLLQYASPFIRLFTFTTSCLILDGSSCWLTPRNGYGEMDGYCFVLLFHRRVNCVVPLRT